MQKYTLNQIFKTLEKLFEGNYITTKQVKTIKWEQLDKINKNFTPVEKSLIMDLKNAVEKRKLIEFFAGKEIEEEKNDTTI